jgi:hypothetical protein
MSEENVEIVRRLFPGGMDMVALFSNPDLLNATRAGIEPFVEPEFETVGDPDALPIGTNIGVEDGPREVFARGVDGFLNFWREWNSAWESWILGTPEFIDVDENRVLVFHEVRARSRTDQVEVAFEAANLMSLRAGKLIRLELFFNREKALEAAGLSE